MSRPSSSTRRGAAHAAPLLGGDTMETEIAGRCLDCGCAHGVLRSEIDHTYGEGPYGAHGDDTRGAAWSHVSYCQDCGGEFAE